ncbi:hypothetical protein BJY52DRAFT_942228 [Lactarius psammicola]|nr:hypothetical protein BJY52DRAFT_942228 [Lactarius psammicola]
MLTFRPTASGPLVAFIAFTSLSQYITGTHAQSQLPACASPCVTTAIATSGCSSADTTCLCASDPFLIAFTSCINEGCSADDIQPALTFYSIACAGGPGFSTDAPPSSTTGSGTSSSIIATLPSTALTTTTTGSLSPTTTSSLTSTTSSRTTTTTNTSSTSTPSTGSTSTRTADSSPTNAAAGMSSHAHAAAAVMAGGIGAFVAIAV